MTSTMPATRPIHVIDGDLATQPIRMPVLPPVPTSPATGRTRAIVGYYRGPGRTVTSPTQFILGLHDALTRYERQQDAELLLIEIIDRLETADTHTREALLVEKAHLIEDLLHLSGQA